MRIAVRGGIIMKYCETCGHYNVCKDKANYVVNCPDHIEPVRYGKWRKECYMGDCDYYCSLCGTHALYIENSFDEILSKYCPNCGAKMYGWANGW